MPSITTTLEDSSPVISYSSDWIPGASTDDQFDQYSAGFMVTQTQGGTATVTFNGTSIQFFGSKRFNHGNYQVTVDGQQFPAQSGQSDSNQFQTLLFAADNLSQGSHTAVFTNLGSGNAPFVDLDFITVKTDIGSDDGSDRPVVNTIQDDDPAFSYSPASAWTNNPDRLGTFAGSSGHSTNTTGSSLTYTFEGDGLSLYGPVGPPYSAYTVQLDGGIGATYSATKAHFAPKSLMFQATNLGTGQHTVKINYQAASPGQTLAIDYAEVYTTNSAAATQSGGSNKFAGSAIAGLVIGLLACIGIAACLVYLFLRKRRQGGQQYDTEKRYPTPPPLDLNQEDRVTPYPNYTTNLSSGSSDRSSSGLSHSHGYAYTQPASAPTWNPLPEQPAPSHSGGEVTVYEKGRPVVVPSTSSGQSSTQNGNGHILEGQPGDFGQGPGPSNYDGRVAIVQPGSSLPPDYSQATHGEQYRPGPGYF